MKMKKIFILLCLLLLFLWFVFWTEENNLWTWSKNMVWSISSTWDKNNCSLYKKQFSIFWPDNLRVWYYVNFKVKWIKNITWNIYRADKKVFSYVWDIFLYSFKSPWKVVLQANFKYKNCNISLQKKIYIYNVFLVSIMNNKDVSILSSFLDNTQNVYYKNFDIDTIIKNKNLLNMSDYIIIDQSYVIPFLIKIWKDKEKYSNKKFIFLVSSAKWFFLRILIPYIKWLNKDNIYVYKKERFLEIFTKIYQWKKLDKINLLSSSNIANKIYFPLSYFVNKLIENNFNIEILWIILLALLWTIIVAFFRQVIWFSVFGVYTPLIFSILIINLWYKIVWLLFLISIFSSLITYFITKKVYILYSAKISLNYIIYVILSIFIIWWLMSYFYFNFSDVNLSIILPFFIMPLLTKNLIKEDTKLFSKKFILFITEFVFIVFIILSIFKISLLKYILIAYPDILWILGIIVVLIGRFTWLQLLEYIRFYPLIKKNFYEEEE